jgi:hypothetical protein
MYVQLRLEPPVARKGTMEKFVTKSFTLVAYLMSETLMEQHPNYEYQHWG